MFERIMVPVDGSALAEFALGPAVAIARRAGARLEIATVVEPEHHEERDAAADWVGRYQDLLVEQLTELIGRPPCRAVLRGEIVPALTAHARERDVDLIILASHGRGSLSRLWLGSVTDGLIRHVSAPVLVVRPPEGIEADLSKEPNLGPVVVALDTSARAETALDPAVAFARLFGARLTLLHVNERQLGLDSPYIPHAARHIEEVSSKRREDAAGYLRILADRLGDADLRVDTVVRSARNPTEGILRFVAEQGAGLIVLATHGRGGVPRLLLGSVADKVLRATETPLLIQRPFC